MKEKEKKSESCNAIKVKKLEAENRELKKKIKEQEEALEKAKLAYDAVTSHNLA